MTSKKKAKKVLKLFLSLYVPGSFKTDEVERMNLTFMQ